MSTFLPVFTLTRQWNEHPAISLHIIRSFSGYIASLLVLKLITHPFVLHSHKICLFWLAFPAADVVGSVQGMTLRPDGSKPDKNSFQSYVQIILSSLGWIRVNSTIIANPHTHLCKLAFQDCARKQNACLTHTSLPCQQTSPAVGRIRDNRSLA